MSRRTGAVVAGVVVLVALALLIWSRTRREPDDEQLLLQLIDDAAEAAEQRDLERLRAMLSRDYRDGAGRSYGEISQLVTIYFLRQGRIAVYLLGKEVELDPAAEPRAAAATVKLVVTRGGRAKELSDVIPEAARSLIFSLRFRKEQDDAWRVLGATWKDGDDLRQLLGQLLGR
jgi:hypothetical protein